MWHAHRDLNTWVPKELATNVVKIAEESSQRSHFSRNVNICKHLCKHLQTLCISLYCFSLQAPVAFQSPSDLHSKQGRSLIHELQVNLTPHHLQMLAFVLENCTKCTGMQHLRSLMFWSFLLCHFETKEKLLVQMTEWRNDQWWLSDGRSKDATDVVLM